jgi:hypothetical protein
MHYYCFFEGEIMAKKLLSKSLKISEIHIEFKYIMLVILAAMINYVAYYLKYPNVWGSLVNIVLLGLLIYDFKNIDGLKVIVYSIILSILSLPITVFMLKIPLVYQLIVFLINTILMVVIAVGLKHLRKWGFYISIITFILSIASLVMMVWPSINYFTPNIYYISLLLKQSISTIFYVLAIVYILKHRDYFK